MSRGRLTISQEVYDAIMDPSKRDPEIEAARQRTLARVKELRETGGLLKVASSPLTCPVCLRPLTSRGRGVWVCHPCSKRGKH